MSYLIRVLTTVTACFVLLLMVQAAPASAHVLPGCDGSGGVGDDGGEVEGCIHSHPPGEDGDDDPGSVEPPSPAELWNTYCSDFGGYVLGYEVTFRSATPLTPEDLESEGLPADGDYVYQTIGCDCGPGCGAVFETVVPAGAIPAVDPIVLRDRARARIVVPDPSLGSNPPLDEAGRFGVVHIPTWLWIDDPWGPLPTETETEGAVTVTVTAHPRFVMWETGDGRGPLRCEDGGVPWSSGLPDTATACSHTFVTSSAGNADGVYAMSASVNWDFEWTINGVPQTPFGDYVATTEFTYGVGEIQAVES